MSNKRPNKIVEKKSQAELEALFKSQLITGVGRSVKHESADKQVSGQAQYIDDKLEFPNQLHVYARMSEYAHAKILKRGKVIKNNLLYNILFLIFFVHYQVNEI